MTETTQSSLFRMVEFDSVLQHIRCDVAEYQTMLTEATLLLKVIALTAYTSEIDQQQVLDAGFH